MELRTERLVLRPFASDDLGPIRDFAGDPEYRRYLGPEHPDADDFVAANLDVDWAREPSWVICLGGDVVGSVFLGVRDDGTAELAYLLAPAVWGRGIAIEASRGAIAHAFGILGVTQVVARADPRNQRSIRVMQKLGMTRQRRWGRRHDSEVVYLLTAGRFGPKGDDARRP